MLKKFYVALGSALIGLYVTSSIFGWEWFNPHREVQKSAVRQTPGAYRSYYMWHRGFRGGK